MLAPNVYTLPTIDFVGGSTQDLVFHTFFRKIDVPFDLTYCTANFSVINYVNKHGTPIISKQMQIDKGDKDVFGDIIVNLLRVTLEARETVGLEGKFIYQISIKDNTNKVEIPNLGILYISNNINKSYVPK